MPEFKVDDVKRIMRDCAGEDEAVNLDGEVADVPLTDLGYDSLALLETASRVEREFGVALPEERLGQVTTLNEFVALVNGCLAEKV